MHILFELAKVTVIKIIS